MSRNFFVLFSLFFFAKRLFILKMHSPKWACIKWMCFLQFTLWQLQNASSCDTFSYLKPVSAIFVAYFLSARKVVKKWHFNCKLLKYEIKFTQKQCQISGLAVYSICRKVTFSERKLFLIKINLKCKRKKKTFKK